MPRFVAGRGVQMSREWCLDEQGGESSFVVGRGGVQMSREGCPDVWQMSREWCQFPVMFSEWILIPLFLYYIYIDMPQYYTK